MGDVIDILKPITPQEAMSLIRLAQKNGVLKLKFGTLEVEFKSETEIDNTRAPRPALKVSKSEVREAEEQLELQENFEDVKDRLSTLHIEDPVGFENAIAAKELDEQRGGETFEETQYSGAESAL